MKQMSLFKSDRTSCSLQPKFVLFIDGAARNNPGPAGAGVYLSQGTKPIVQEGHFLGIRTNNQAEYLALLLGIFYLKQHALPGDEVCIKSDSELLVRQMQGTYKVKHPELHRLQRAAFSLLSIFSYGIEHIMRDKNTQADALANQGIDKKVVVSEAFIAMLRSYDVAW
ncbi:ribonuclease HI family protein [Candidatus Babeliales bacterium]|nr:ribonuclease HI family protein [Candidatus Babeliales bacterium]